MSDTISVLLVDDHRIIRDGLKAILREQPGIKVVGEAGNGRQAIEAAAKLGPDVVLMDIAMPIMNGVEATRHLTKSLKGVKVLVLSMYDDEKFVFQALKAGASGYIVKNASSSELIDAIRSVKDGNLYFSQSISRMIMEDYISDEKDRPRKGSSDRLTSRENEVLQLIAEGYSNKEIAGLMGISVKTVETHRARIMNKLDLHDVAGLTKYAIRAGLVVLEK